MISVISILNCIDVDTSQDISVLRKLFGFFRAQVPTDPCDSETAEVSLLNQVKALQGKFVNLNIIRVGIDNFSDSEINKIDYAIYRAHQIFNTRSLGIGRIEHYNVTSAEADGKDNIGSESEAEDLTKDWSVPNDGLDVFMVDNISAGFVGLSPVPGPDKDMDGVLGGEVNRSSSEVARTFSHEIGHYLGLPHNHGDNCPTSSSGRNNLMAQTRCASSVCNSVVLSSSQGNIIRGHDSINDGC